MLHCHIDLSTFHISLEIIPVAITFIGEISRIVVGITPSPKVTTQDEVLRITITNTFSVIANDQEPVMVILIALCMVDKLSVESLVSWDSEVIREGTPPCGRTIFCTDRYIYLLLFTATTIATNGLVPVTLVHLIANQCHVIDRETAVLSSAQLIACRTYI